MTAPDSLAKIVEDMKAQARAWWGGPERERTLEFAARISALIPSKAEREPGAYTARRVPYLPPEDVETLVLIAASLRTCHKAKECESCQDNADKLDELLDTITCGTECEDCTPEGKCVRHSKLRALLAERGNE